MESFVDKAYVSRLKRVYLKTWRSSYQIRNSRNWNLKAFLHARDKKTKTDMLIRWKSRIVVAALSKAILRRLVLKLKMNNFSVWILRTKQKRMAARYQQNLLEARIRNKFGTKGGKSLNLKSFCIALKLYYLKLWNSRLARIKKLLRVVTNIKLLKTKQQCLKYWKYRVYSKDGEKMEYADRYLCYRFFLKWLNEFNFNRTRENYAIQYHHESIVYPLVFRWKKALDLKRLDHRKVMILVKSWKKWRSASHRFRFQEGRKMVNLLHDLDFCRELVCETAG